MIRRVALGLATWVAASCASAPAPRAGADVRSPWAERSELRIPVPVHGAPGRGASEPLVTIVVFSDFECPYCRESSPILEQIVARHASDVRLHFRHLPLPFHQHAQLAAEAAAEALAQGGPRAFWAFHDRLFSGGLRPDELVAHAGALGLDGARFELALRGRVHRALVERDIELAEELGIDGTPTLFLNGRPVLGVPPFDELDMLVGAELALARDALARGVPRAELYDYVQRDATEIVRARLAQRERARAARAAQADGDRDADSEQEPPPEDQRASLPPPPDAPRRGAARPALVVQVFSDFQCPFCGRVLPTLERLLREFPEVQLVYRHHPLTIHPEARLAAMAAIEVHRELGDTAFWAFHDRIFALQGALTRELLVAGAREVGANGDRVGSAIDSARHARIVDADLAAVSRAGLRIGTPAFLIGERLLLGAQPYEAFERAIREELAAGEGERH